MFSCGAIHFSVIDDRETLMRTKGFLLILIAGLGVALICPELSLLRGQAPTSVGLTGQVSSKEEGPMEGVVVSAKRAGSTITVSVVTDRQGQYKFPRERMEPGQYSLKMRAAGYDLDDVGPVEIVPDKTATADLKLHKAKDLSSQLTNAEWLLSMPGTEEQKSFLLNCMTCHTIERIAKSTHNADEWMPLFERMASYAPGSDPTHPQKRILVNEGFANPDRLRKQAEYMSTINLSSGDVWSYELKTLPRPSGKGTQVIVTQYDLPRRETMPHDVVVDAKGMVWYTDFGKQYVGRLDPKTAEVTEFQVPVLKPGFPLGILEVDTDKAGDVWLAMMLQGGVARFNPATQKFTTWTLPKDVDNDASQIAMVMPVHDDVDGKVWTNDAGSHMIHRLDISTGKIETFDPYSDIRSGPNGSAQGNTVYGVVSDSHNNALFMDFGKESVGKIDAKTGKIKLYPTPTLNSRPRRGRVDSQDRLWFGEFRANKIAMFDPQTEQFREYLAPSPWDAPYDVAPDNKGEVWSAGISSDHVMRLDTATGQFIEYLLPAKTTIRRVFVDSSTTPATFWLGSNHGASILKVEPLDSMQK
jgi:streptogramin lyase